MSDMTDERAAEVLAAHNEWRRYDGETGEPGAPEMGDPTELGRAIDHAVSRLRSQPPAEAQAVAKLVNRVDSDGGKTTTFIRPTSLGMGLPLGEYPLHLHTPPSAPVGVEGRAREAVALALDEAGHPTEANNVRSGIDLGEYRVELSAARIALAQQPAAVNEAMVERALQAWFETDDWVALLSGIEPAASSRSRMRAALTAALAAQQGGRSDD